MKLDAKCTDQLNEALKTDQNVTFNRLLTKPLGRSTQVLILHSANHNEHYTQIASVGQSFPCH